MEALILLTLYDNRWMLMGRLVSWDIFDFHADIRVSNVLLIMAIIQAQVLMLIAGTFMYNQY